MSSQPSITVAKLGLSADIDIPLEVTTLFKPIFTAEDRDTDSSDRLSWDTTILSVVEHVVESDGVREDCGCAGVELNECMDDTDVITWSECREDSSASLFEVESRTSRQLRGRAKMARLRPFMISIFRSKSGGADAVSYTGIIYSTAWLTHLSAILYFLTW